MRSPPGHVWDEGEVVMTLLHDGHGRWAEWVVVPNSESWALLLCHFSHGGCLCVEPERGRCAVPQVTVCESHSVAGGAAHTWSVPLVLDDD